MTFGGDRPPGDRPSGSGSGKPSQGRVALWIVVGGIGLYLLVSGLLQVFGVIE